MSDAKRIQALTECVRFLVRAIDSYHDNPGCNIPARQTALRKLKWASEEATQKLEAMG